MITVLYSKESKRLSILKDGKLVGGCIGKMAEKNYNRLMQQVITVINQ
jgi:hypothetical protein